MYACFAYIYACVAHVCSAYGYQKRASYPLELELQKVVNGHVGPLQEQQTVLATEPSVSSGPTIVYSCLIIL